jgi:hypothetical protein
MYAKIGKFKPGDNIKGDMNPFHYKDSNTTVKIVGIKQRKNGTHKYKIMYVNREGQRLIKSMAYSYIDKNFELSLNSILKNL